MSLGARILSLDSLFLRAVILEGLSEQLLSSLAVQCLCAVLHLLLCAKLDLALLCPHLHRVSREQFGLRIL